MIKKLSFGFFIFLLVFVGIIYLRATPAPPHPFLFKTTPLAIAHRGGLGLWPENTLYAFEKAVEMGVDILEMDVRNTTDGILVVLHDSDVDRTTNGTGPVAGLSLKAVKELDAGYRWSGDNGQTFPFRGLGIKVPTLRETLETLPTVFMSIEIKQEEPSLAAPLCQNLREYGKTDRVLVNSFHMDALEKFRHFCPEVATSASAEETKYFYLMNLLFLGPLYSPPFQALQVPEYSGGRHVATRRFIETAHDRNLSVAIWTVNEEDDMKRLLDLGADGIITDYPDRLLSALGRLPFNASRLTAVPLP